MSKGTEPPTAPRTPHSRLPTALSVCGWVKSRAHISLLIILCIIVYVTNKAHQSLIIIIYIIIIIINESQHFGRCYSCLRPLDGHSMNRFKKLQLMNLFLIQLGLKLHWFRMLSFECLSELFKLKSLNLSQNQTLLQKRSCTFILKAKSRRNDCE